MSILTGAYITMRCHLICVTLVNLQLNFYILTAVNSKNIVETGVNLSFGEPALDAPAAQFVTVDQ